MARCVYQRKGHIEQEGKVRAKGNVEREPNIISLKIFCIKIPYGESQRGIGAIRAVAVDKMGAFKSTKLKGLIKGMVDRK